MSHLQFTRDSRVELAALLTAHKSQTACAKILGIDRSNVCLEIKRNKDPDGSYQGGSAQRKYLERRKQAKRKYRKIENDGKLRKHIVLKLKKFWSPEQIAGRLKRVRGKSAVCHETIYTHLYERRPDLIKYLRRQRNKYRKRRGTRARIKLNKGMKVKRIEERPAVVLERSRIGDWEDDTVIGKEKVQRIWTCVERRSGYGLADKPETVTAEIINDVSASHFKKIPKKKRCTLTRDNGLEFGDLDSTLERKTGLEVYRANPYHSWERGTNENWNGLWRQFFPKGTYFATITEYQVQTAVRLLNDRPRKRLGYATPREVFRGCCDSS